MPAPNPITVASQKTKRTRQGSQSRTPLSALGSLHSCSVKQLAASMRNVTGQNISWSTEAQSKSHEIRTPETTACTSVAITLFDDDLSADSLMPRLCIVLQFQKENASAPLRVSDPSPVSCFKTTFERSRLNLRRSIHPVAATRSWD